MQNHEKAISISLNNFFSGSHFRHRTGFNDPNLSGGSGGAHSIIHQSTFCGVLYPIGIIQSGLSEKSESAELQYAV